MTDRVIKILGTEYSILFDSPQEEMPEGADGCMDCSTKTIRIAKIERTRNSVQNIETYIKKVLRHEIIHAFLFESGIWSNSGGSDNWGQDETITDWIAIQSPKMFKVFQELSIL